MTDDTPIINARPEQDEIVREIYRHIADLIPIAGRDFEVSITFDNNDVPKIKMKGLTHFGNIWVKELANYFKENYGY